MNRRSIIPRLPFPWLSSCAWAVSSLAWAAAEPADLLRSGKFKEAQAAFEFAAAQRPADARWRYNAGVAAFKAGDAAAAEKHFEAATAATELQLQQRAWYNLGAARFQKSQTPGLEDKEAVLAQAAEALGAAVQLAPNDRPASENLAAVKQILEELQQQPEQPPQSGDQKQKPKPKKPKSDQAKKNDPKDKSAPQDKNKSPEQAADQDSKPDQKEPDPSQQSQAGDSSGTPGGKDGEQKGSPGKDGSKPETASKDEKRGEDKTGEGDSEKKDEAAKKGEKGQQANKQSPPDPNKSPGDKTGIQRADGKKSDAGEPGDGAGQSVAEAMAEAEAKKGNVMTAQQAKQMLDAQKGGEKPIWTVVRGWGQENQARPSSGSQRRTW